MSHRRQPAWGDDEEQKDSSIARHGLSSSNHNTTQKPFSGSKASDSKAQQHSSDGSRLPLSKNTEPPSRRVAFSGNANAVDQKYYSEARSALSTSKNRQYSDNDTEEDSHPGTDSESTSGDDELSEAQRSKTHSVGTRHREGHQRHNALQDDGSRPINDVQPPVSAGTSQGRPTNRTTRPTNPQRQTEERGGTGYHDSPGTRDRRQSANNNAQARTAEENSPRGENLRQSANWPHGTDSRHLTSRSQVTAGTETLERHYTDAAPAVTGDRATRNDAAISAWSSVAQQEQDRLRTGYARPEISHNAPSRASSENVRNTDRTARHSSGAPGRPVESPSASSLPTREERSTKHDGHTQGRSSQQPRGTNSTSAASQGRAGDSPQGTVSPNVPSQPTHGERTTRHDGIARANVSSQPALEDRSLAPLGSPEAELNAYEQFKNLLLTELFSGDNEARLKQALTRIKKNNSLVLTTDSIQIAASSFVSTIVHSIDKKLAESVGKAKDQPWRNVIPDSPMASKKDCDKHLAQYIGINQFNVFLPKPEDGARPAASTAASTIGSLTDRAVEAAKQIKLPNELIPGLAKIGLFDVVIFCDNSGSLNWNYNDRREDRIAPLKETLNHITGLMTRICPAGVNIVWLNENGQGKTWRGIKSVQEVSTKTQRLKCDGGTPLGRKLRDDVLEPFVLKPVRSGTLERPVIVAIITDGEPTEGENVVLKTISACNKELSRSKRYPDSSVLFLFSLLGTDNKAKEFILSLRRDPTVRDSIHCSDEDLMHKAEAFKSAKNDEYYTVMLARLFLAALEKRTDNPEYHKTEVVLNELFRFGCGMRLGERV